MSTLAGGNYYEKLGVRPLINAMGNSTVLGGSTPTPALKEAMDEAGERYVEMSELLAKSGDFIADLLGTEAAYPTSGCAAALSLSAAACMTGNDCEKMARLPDTSGMKNEILIQRAQRYGADPCLRFSGARLVEVGDETGCTTDQLEQAIGPNTAAIAYFQQTTWDDSVLTLEDTASVGRRTGVPVIADAASQIYPLDRFRETAQTADLACFGGKYYGGATDTGLVAGRRDLIDAVAAQGFAETIPYGDIPAGHGYAFGRGMKVARQDVVAMVVALEGWFLMNHEDRIGEYERKMSVIQSGLAGISYVEASPIPHDSYLVTQLQVRIGSDSVKSAQEVVDELDAGTPRIKVRFAGGDSFTIVPHTLNEGEEDILAERLSSVLIS